MPFPAPIAHLRTEVIIPVEPVADFDLLKVGIGVARFVEKGHFEFFLYVLVILRLDWHRHGE